MSWESGGWVGVVGQVGGNRVASLATPAAAASESDRQTGPTLTNMAITIQTNVLR